MHNLQLRPGVYDRIDTLMSDPFSYNRMRAIVGDNRQVPINKIQRDPIYDTCGQQFNSLKMLEANDSSYLDKFIPRSKSANDIELRMMLRNQYISKKKSDQNKLSVPGHTKKLALLGNLSKCRSEEHIYESVERIQFRKTLLDIDRQNKTRSLQRSGHPLFDHLREEQAINGPKPNENGRRPRIRSTGAYNFGSNGSSISPSSSSAESGDEYEPYHPKIKKPDPEYVYFASLRRNQQNQQNNNKDIEIKPQPVKKEKKSTQFRENIPPRIIFEIDEDWNEKTIPRPSLKNSSKKIASKSPKKNVPYHHSSSSNESSPSSTLR